MNEKIGLTFHEKLQLGRARIAEVLSAVSIRPGASNDELRALTSLGTNMTKAFPRLAQGCGLLTKNRHLTDFGAVVVRADPGLDNVQTLWIMHFNLVWSLGPGPEFWNYTFKNALRLGQALATDDLAHSLRDQGIGATIQPDTVREAVSAMLGFYTSRDGLNQLELVGGSRSEGFSCNHNHDLPSSAVLAYMAARCWESRFDSQMTVELEQFELKSELPEILRVSRNQLRDLFRTLADEHLCDLYLSAVPYQIVRAWGSSKDLLGKIYEGH